MNKFFYARLAASNIKKNAKIQIPFMITSILTVSMFYILLSLSQNQGFRDAEVGSTMIPIILGLGCWIVGIFAVIFLFYTYSFLIKRRQKEFGLFNILGMEKKHIAKIIALETFYTAFISIVVGLLAGVILDKLMYLLLLRIVNLQTNLTHYISLKPIIITSILFVSIFIVLFLYSMLKVRLTNPIQLLHGGQVGEKEPKTKILMAIIGLLCLGIGYYLSIMTKDAVNAVNLFFIAVIFVIIGTYFLFVAGSIALLKMLRKNKKYYYKTSHFISISGMLYRMKKNAVGLANICILSTMVLVMLSTTLSMMLGLDDVLNRNYPYDISFDVSNTEYYDVSDKDIEKAVKDIIAKHNLNITEENSYRNISLYSDNIKFKSDINNIDCMVRVIPLSDYNSCTNQNKTLSQKELLFYTNTGISQTDKIKLMDNDYKILEYNSDIPKVFIGLSGQISTALIIVNDEEFNNINKQFSKYNEEISDIDDYQSSISNCHNMNISGSDSEKLLAYNDCFNELENSPVFFRSRVEQKTAILSIYGSLFFIALFLGILFIGAMVLIIYYKQISEGYEDRERFDIMQKIGLSYREAKKAIRSQILTVFFLPLITACIHVVFAFPMISRILSLMTLSNDSINLNNTQLYIWCTLTCFLVFAILYMVIYIATARTYYKIVKSGANTDLRI